MNAAARAKLCYVSLASPALSLQATSTHTSSLHEHVAAQKILESLKNWSGRGLSNRTGRFFFFGRTFDLDFGNVTMCACAKGCGLDYTHMPLD